MNLVHMVIDETAALGHHEVIDDMLSLGRGYSIRVHLFFQNAAQLMKSYPDGQHQFVLGTTTNIFFGAHDWVTCEEISKRSGSQTVVADSGGDGDGDTRQHPDSGPGSFGTSRNRSRNWAFAGKPLIRPEQVAALPDRAAVTFAPGAGAPILSWVTRYYEESPPPEWPARAWAQVRPVLMSLWLFGCAVGLSVFATIPPRPRSPPAGQPTNAPRPFLKVRTSWPGDASGRPSSRPPATWTTNSGSGPAPKGRPKSPPR